MSSNEPRESGSKKLLWAILTIIILPAFAIVAKKVVDRWYSAPDIRILSLTPERDMAITNDPKRQTQHMVKALPLGKKGTVKIVIQNSGDVAAEGCQIKLRADVDKFVIKNSDTALSESYHQPFYNATGEFELLQNQTKELILETPVFTDPVPGKLVARIQCRNAKPSEQEMPFLVM